MTTLVGAIFDCMIFLQVAINRRGPSFACKELLEQVDSLSANNPFEQSEFLVGQCYRWFSGFV
jgi:hypothetical protein